MTTDSIDRIIAKPPSHFGYVVESIPTAVETWSKMGIGPWLLIESPEFDLVESGGEAAVFDHNAAFGWWGTVGVELQEYNDLRPELAAKNMRAGEGPQLNHIAYESATPAEDSARLEELGLPLFLFSRYGEIEERLHWVPALGHVIQIHPESEFLTNWWRMVRQASEGWDGSEPLRLLDPAAV